MITQSAKITPTRHKISNTLLARYIAAARRSTSATRGPSGGRGRTGRTTSGGSRDYDPKAVRAWAESQSINVSARGRVPADLVARFHEANT